MRLAKEQLMIAAGAGGVFLLAAVYFLLYAPLIDKLRAAEGECRRLERELVQIEKNISSANVAPGRRQFIREGQSALAIEELTVKAGDAGLSLAAVTPQPVEEKTRYSVLPIRMEIESDFTQLGVFLEGIEDLTKSVVTVGEFAVLPAEGNAVHLKTDLTLNMYLKHE